MEESKKVKSIPFKIVYASGYTSFMRSVSGTINYFVEDEKINKNEIFLGSAGLEIYGDNVPQWIKNRNFRSLFGKYNTNNVDTSILLIEGNPMGSDLNNKNIYLFKKNNVVTLEGTFRGKGFRVADKETRELVDLTHNLNYEDMAQFFKEEIIPKYDKFSSKIKITKS